jgi:trehalose-6-phosphate synthase
MSDSSECGEISCDVDSVPVRLLESSVEREQFTEMNRVSDISMIMSV